MRWGLTSGLQTQYFRDIREDVLWEMTAELKPEADEEGEREGAGSAEQSVQTQDQCDRRPEIVWMSPSFKAEA